MHACRMAGAACSARPLLRGGVRTAPSAPLHPHPPCPHADANQHSAPTSRVGTPAYLAPEVITNQPGQVYDGPAADVWSCGVLLYILVTDRYPFRRGRGRTCWSMQLAAACCLPPAACCCVCIEFLARAPTPRVAAAHPNAPPRSQAAGRRRDAAQPEAQRHAAAHPARRLRIPAREAAQVRVAAWLGLGRRVGHGEGVGVVGREGQLPAWGERERLAERMAGRAARRQARPQPTPPLSSPLLHPPSLPPSPAPPAARACAT